MSGGFFTNLIRMRSGIASWKMAATVQTALSGRPPSCVIPRIVDHFGNNSHVSLKPSANAPAVLREAKRPALPGRQKRKAPPPPSPTNKMKVGSDGNQARDKAAHDSLNSCPGFASGGMSHGQENLRGASRIWNPAIGEKALPGLVIGVTGSVAISDRLLAYPKPQSRGTVGVTTRIIGGKMVTR